MISYRFFQSLPEGLIIFVALFICNGESQVYDLGSDHLREITKKYVNKYLIKYNTIWSIRINLKFKNAIYEYFRTHKVVRKNRLNVDLGRLGDTSPCYEGLYSKKAISLFR